MANLPYIVAAVLIGAGISMQPPINAAMARGLDSPMLAAAVSITISFVIVVPLWLLASRGQVDLSQVRQLPWWVLVGGVLGVVFVAGSIMVAPVLGVAMFFVCVVAGQLVGASLIDQFGAFGTPVKHIDIMKLLGLALVIAGAALVQSSRS